MKLEIDRLSAKRWLFPLNQPKRDYQFNIVRKCLFENTLVALPTGLGKTFIAGVVMLNCEDIFYSLSATADFPPSLYLVSRRQGCLCCADKTSCGAADRCMSPDMWDPRKPCCRADWPELSQSSRRSCMSLVSVHCITIY